MRISNNMMADNAINHMSENIEQIYRLQEKISTGKQYSSASDNPVATSTILNLRSSLTTLGSYLDTTNLAKDWMTASEFGIQQLEEMATHAISLVTGGLNDTLSSAERRDALGTELTAMIDQALGIANSQHNGNYIYSGYKLQTKPFELTGPSTVDYLGDDGVMQRTLGPSQSVIINVDGEAAFTPFIEALIQARDALNVNDMTSLRDSLTALQNGLDTLGVNRTSLGARLRQVNTTATYIEKTELEMKSLLSKKEDTNMAEAISQLQLQQTTFQAVLEVSQRAISALSLFDYLR